MTGRASGRGPEPTEAAADLLKQAPDVGQPPRVVATEPGFAIKLVSPQPGDTVATMTPPGQGQLLLPLSGSVLVEEEGGAVAKVVQASRPDRSCRLARGQLFRVANDARWGMVATAPGTVVLAISTSVPREHDRSDDVLELARGRLHVVPRQLFANESVSVEFVAARGHLPFRGWLPYAHRAAGPQYSIVLAGAFEARTYGGPGGPWKGALPEGWLLRVDAGVRHRFRAGASGLCVRLSIASRVHLQTDDDARPGPFTPFARP